MSELGSTKDIITDSRFFQSSRGMPSGQMPPPQQSNPCGYQNMPAAPSGKDLLIVNFDNRNGNL